MADLAFILVAHAQAPAPERVVAAAQRYGLELAPAEGLTFHTPDGASLAVTLVSVPHPDAPTMPVAVTSPPPEEVAAAKAHLIVAAFGLTGPPRERDTRMAILTAAVVDAVGTDAVAAMLGHGVAFHRARVFADGARLAADEGEPLPAEVAIDVTAAQESAQRMSFLTHGLRRYGREEFYVTCPIEGTGALSFLLGLTRWMLVDPDKQLPTGDTVGRTADERILVQRVPSPTGEGPEVIRLDLP